MTNNMGKKRKINISKKTLDKIEIIILCIIVLIAIITFVNTRTLSIEDATSLANEKYIEVEEVLSKVLVSTDWMDLSEVCIEQDGYKFCKSQNQSFLKYSDLEKYINTVCTKDLTNSILKEKEVVFKNIDDQLYVLDSSRGTDIFYAGVKEIKVVEVSSHEIKCEVVCNYYIDLDTKELYTMSFDFILKKQFGDWKASFFELPY